MSTMSDIIRGTTPTITKTINMFTGTTFSSTYLSFSVNSSHQLVITNNVGSTDIFTVIKSW